MKIKLIFSDYDKETGISTTTIRDAKGREFTAISKLHEEDKDIESSFAGCGYAERKAFIKCLKAEMKDISIQIKTLEDLEKSFMNMKEYNPHSLWMRKIRKRKYELVAKRNSIKEFISKIKKNMMDEMENRANSIAKIKKG